MGKYFTIDEMIRSTKADQLHIDNTPTKEVMANLEFMIQRLDDLREAWAVECKEKGYGKPGLIVTSGYRCPELNAAVGGSKTSSHMMGNAADIVPSNGKKKEFILFTFDYLKKNEIVFDQAINEYNFSWLHISFKNNRGVQRCQYLKIK